MPLNDPFSFSHPVFVFIITTSAPPSLYTLSLHDALPISLAVSQAQAPRASARDRAGRDRARFALHALRRVHASAVDRKSTRLNSSHPSISYAVFCLKKKNIIYCIELNRSGFI